MSGVIDLETRRLVGYCLSKRMSADIVIKAFEMETPDSGCIFHSDQSSRDSINAFQSVLNKRGFRSCLTLMRKCLRRNKYFSSRAGNRLWIRYYNGKIFHSKLDGKSPVIYASPLNSSFSYRFKNPFLHLSSTPCVFYGA